MSTCSDRATAAERGERSRLDDWHQPYCRSLSIILLRVITSQGFYRGSSRDVIICFCVCSDLLCLCVAG